MVNDIRSEFIKIEKSNDGTYNYFVIIGGTNDCTNKLYLTQSQYNRLKNMLIREY